MKLGIYPPTISRIVDPAWLTDFAREAEAAGCESIWTGEHPFFAVRSESLYPYSEDGKLPAAYLAAAELAMPDPLEWLSFIAAVTTRIKLGTAMLLAPLHTPGILAKRIATLDRLSGGRLLLGLGAGWQKEEYLSANVPFEERGRRLDEIIVAMRTLWTQSPASFEGAHYRYPPVHSDPKPVAPGGPPLIIGGSSAPAARRAGRIGDGFFPYAISPEDLADKIGIMRRAAAEAGRDPAAIEITAWPGSYDPARGSDPAFIGAYAALGVSRLIIGGWEAGSEDPAEIGRYARRYREDLIAGLQGDSSEMQKIIIFVKRGPSMTPEEFREYYETKHALLGPRYVDGILTEFRRYYPGKLRPFPAHWGELVTPNPDVQEVDFGFDAIAVYTFKDEAAVVRYIEIMNDPEIGQIFMEDEARFIDRENSLTGLCDALEGEGMVSEEGMPFLARAQAAGA